MSGKVREPDRQPRHRHGRGGSLLTPEIAKKALALFGAAKFDLSHKPWVTTSCPLAEWRHAKGTDRNPSFGVLTGMKGGRVHCFSCHFSGTLDTLAAELALLKKGSPGVDLPALWALLEGDDDKSPLVLASGDLVPEHPVPFTEAWVKSFPSALHSPDAMVYLGERGFGAEDVVGSDLRWDGLRRRVSFPVRGFDGRVYGMRGRAVDPTNKARYWDYDCAGIRNPTVMLGEHEVDFDKPIVLVEGPFDRLSVRRAYRNVVTPFSSAVTVAQMERLQEAYLLVTMPDGDEAGDLMHQKVVKYAKCHVGRANVPLDSDPGKMSVSEVRASLKAAGCPTED
jgi:hypothetical protein